MPEIHTVVGYVVVGVFTVGWVWGAGAAVWRKDPGPRFWQWLAVAQIVAGLQAIAGVVLLVMGRRPTDGLHIVYGFGPLLILLIAHGLAREVAKGGSGPSPLPSWAVFAFASFISFGLSLRALMTGLGSG